MVDWRSENRDGPMQEVKKWTTVEKYQNAFGINRIKVNWRAKEKRNLLMVFKKQG